MKAPRLRLLFAIRSLANPGGGAERVLCDVTSFLSGRGHRVTVVTFDWPGQQPFYTFSGQVHAIPLGVGDARRSARFFESLLRTYRLRSILREVRPDAAVGFMHSMFIPLGIAALGTGVPVVASEHNTALNYLGKPWWHRQALRLSPLISRGATVPSEGARRTYPRRISEQMTVIEDSVALERASGVSERDRNLASYVILSVGRLDPQKDHAVLLDAFAATRGEHPNWRLDIVGDGPLRSSLEEQTTRLGLQDSVRFLGFTRDVQSHLREASIFVVPSRYESFGVATAEALACGIPCIGFKDCPGTNELIEHGVNGLLVEGDNRAERLSLGLRELMAASSFRAELGAAGPSSMEKYSVARVGLKWEAYLRGVVQFEPRRS